ncbi:YgiT-type zinc finger protein [Zhengella sp. ZM62]|uniref:YgiT-type zinc finger protein n=1 Tax=Zhengella sedimenti TaxID=3390035 RepID=UPI003975E7C3
MERSTGSQGNEAVEPDAGASPVCDACQGHRVEPVVTSVVFFWTAIPTIVENVPALLCRDCGERHLDHMVAEKLDGIRRLAGQSVALRHVSVPVFDYESGKS